MAAIAKVVVDAALDREFDYRIPPAMEGAITVGSRVRVPFGRRMVHGYVVGFAERSELPQLKEIDSLTSSRPFLSDAMLRLARWMADYYCAPVELAVRAVLPGAVRRRGTRFKEQAWVTLVPSTAGDAGGRDEPPDLPKGRSRATEAQHRALECLRRADGRLPLSEMLRQAGVSASTVKTLQRHGVVAVDTGAVRRTPSGLRTVLRTEPLEPMPEQRVALERMVAAIDAGAPTVVLLHGVTGSGKTEVYLQSIAHALARGKGAIVLVPEIALTPQTVEQFVGRFGDRVAVLHSHLSDGERHDEWHRVRDGQADIVVGARSAVFAPVGNLGLLIVDEEHEPSYKQDDAPRYNARDVAVMRGHLERCPVVLGSATPSLESWHNVRRGKYVRTDLLRRVDNRQMPLMRVVDMRLQVDGEGRRGVFSRDLLDAIRLRLDRSEQTILFLNRRGFATSLVCSACGYVAACGQCSVAYTYHRQVELLKCHICGASGRVPPACPGCSDPGFKYAGFGTQRIEAIVAKCFPGARVARMDTDTMTRKDAYTQTLGDFRSGRLDILIGTQMIAKGLHFPNVTLVGVVSADTSLHLPDFRAGERTFQLLAQVAGRAGRGDIAGEVLVQTYTPHAPAIQAARRLDYDGFCEEEFAFRSELGYPPSAHLVLLTARGEDATAVRTELEGIRTKLQACCPPSVRLSPVSEAPLARAKGLYRFQILLRHPVTAVLTKAVRSALGQTRLPKAVQVVVDVDALNLL